MTFILIALGILLTLLIIQKITQPKVMEISKKDLSAMLKDKTVKRVYIDVRTPQEFKSNKLKGFNNIPLHLLVKRHKEIPATQPVILLCASGSRSIKAARILTKLGYSQVYSVSGGMH